MRNAAGWGIVGVVVGVLVTLLVQSPDDTVADVAPAAQPPPVTDGEAASAHEIRSLQERMAALETRLEELAGTVAAIPAPVTPAVSAANRVRAPSTGQPTAFIRDPNVIGFSPIVASDMSDRTVARLVEGGFTPAEAERIRERTEAITLEAMQARYEAERNGQPPPPDNFNESALRRDLGDAEYERYLTALGRPTRVNVANVLANSPAASAGMQVGDRIVSYNGSRVFDMRELNPMILANSSGGSVVVEIERAGQRIPLVVPSGPLGIMTTSEGGSAAAVFITQDGTFISGAPAQ